MRRITILLLIAVSLILASCSNPQKDYEPVQQLQNSADQAIQSATDNGAKIRSCDEVITALQEFIKNHPDGEWHTRAATALESWRSKRDAVQEVIDRKSDYDEAQRLQDASEAIMQQSNDFTMRMKSCDDAITSLQAYLSKHPSGDQAAAAKTSLTAWQARKSELDQDLTSLRDKLSLLLRERAVREAKAKHSQSKIEDVRLDYQNTRPLGANIQVTDTYAMQMSGDHGGNKIKLRVSVTGRIDPGSRKVFVDENPKIEE